MKDLIVLTADVQQEKTIATLLDYRYQSMRIPHLSFDVQRHVRRDPGVFHEAPAFLQMFQDSHRKALVLLDLSWDGSPGNAETLRQNLLARLYQQGWDEDCCDVIVITPELESWFWVLESPVVEEYLKLNWQTIREIGRQSSTWHEDLQKPNKPKELLEIILRRQRIPRSSSVFVHIANRVSLNRCSDHAFLQFRETLAKWFG